MATKYESEVENSNSNWSKLMLNDSRELRKKQSRYTGRKYSRRLFSQIKNTPTPNRLRSKPAFYQRFKAKPKREMSNQKKFKSNTGSEWKKEYDVWNMMVQALDQSLLRNHKVNWPNKVIGIRDSSGNIRLIQNRDELQQQILIAPNSGRTHLKDLLDANDSSADISLRMKFKLVPVVETLTLVNKATETPYTFSANSDDPNNNDMQCENYEMKSAEVAKEISVMDEENTLVNVNNHESTGNITCDKTLTNNSCSTWLTCSTVSSVTSTWEYSDIWDDVVPIASSTLISDGDETTPFSMDEKENIPPLPAAKCRAAVDSKTFFDSPIPFFAKKQQHTVNRVEPSEIQQILRLCHNAKFTLQTLYDKVNAIEDRCINGLRIVSGVLSDSMSGFDFLADSFDL